MPPLRRPRLPRSCWSPAEPSRDRYPGGGDFAAMAGGEPSDRVQSLRQAKFASPAEPRISSTRSKYACRTPSSCPPRNRQHGRPRPDVTGSPAPTVIIQAGARATGRAAGHGFDQPPAKPRASRERPSSIERRKEARKALRLSGRSQQTPSGAIQDFHVCGTNCGTVFINYCFYSFICGRRRSGLDKTGRSVLARCAGRQVVEVGAFPDG